MATLPFDSPGESSTRAGTVALLGLPNAGKSSLLNRFLGQKLSIVSPRAQTTREKVLGIDTREGAQIIFTDTPGILETRYLLQEAMLEAAFEAMRDVDVRVFVLDGADAGALPQENVIERLLSDPAPVIPVLNKVDLASKDQVASLSSWTRVRFEREGVRVSATTGEGVDMLRDRIVELLPESPFLYPPDEISAQSVRFFVSELVREAAFELYGEEIPYSIAVRVEEFREGSDPLYIRAHLFVERASQKGIVIGEKGTGIRKLGERARAKIEDFLGTRVFLDLWVKVLPRWKKDPVALRRLGYSWTESKG